MRVVAAGLPASRPAATPICRGDRVNEDVAATEAVEGLPSEFDLSAENANKPLLPSLKRNSAARFLADAAGLVFGVASGVITARGLGPTGKGLFSSLTLLSGIT